VDLAFGCCQMLHQNRVFLEVLAFQQVRMSLRVLVSLLVLLSPEFWLLLKVSMFPKWRVSL
jgi:hypothetical protein